MASLLTPDSIRRLEDGAVQRIVLALSGGMDSISLLHALVRAGLSKPVCALHIDHGLQSASTEFIAVCSAACERYNLPLAVRQVSVDTSGSIETQAREARYAAFEAFVEPGDLLLLAHHADDQIETALFRLFRGSGVPGLEGMPLERPLGQATLYRPLLSVSRQSIATYAKAEGLGWSDDPTNAELTPDRNYIRHEILPAIEARWPDIRAGLGRAMNRDAGMRRVLHQHYADRLASVRLENDALSLDKLQQLDHADRIGLLRAWFLALGFELPRGALLESVASTIAASALVDVETSGFELRQQAGVLYLLNRLAAGKREEFILEPGENPVPGGAVYNKAIKGGRLRPGDFRVRYRSGGESMKIRHTRTLKNLFQENGIPHWLRHRVPLVFAGDELVAVPALSVWGTPMLVSDDWLAPPGSEGLAVSFLTLDREIH